MNSSVTWTDGMTFEAALDGFDFRIDAAPQHGGRELGPRPKGLLLTALAGCTGMDVIAILGKMRVEIGGLRVSADGELTDEHPRRFARIKLVYAFEGEDLPLAKLRRAVRLSEEHYCGVRASLAEDVAVSSEIIVNGEPIAAATDAA